MDVTGLKKLVNDAIDAWAVGTSPTTPGEVTEVKVDKVLPEGQRVVRTKTSGDRVYLLDDNKKTRAWVTNGDVLTALGFDMSDVSEVEDSEMMKYNMAAAIYKAPNATA